MPSLRSLAVLAAFISALAVPIAAAADDEQPLDAATKAEMQGVITKQLDAFAHDDAKAAETFATPAIREKFPEPGKFFDMVKEKYGALIHPKSTQFAEAIPSPHGPAQKVTVVAADGTVWTAVYLFQRIDGAWRISGCGISKDASQQDI